MDLNDLPKAKNIPEVTDADLEALPYAGTSAERTYHQVKGSNPDEAAKIISVANKTGQPVQFVAENFDDVNMDDLKLPSEFWKQMDKQYPGTSKWLSKPENMAVAHDDFDNLPIFERYIKEATFGFRQNSLQNKLSELRGKQMDELRKTGKISPQYQTDVTNTKSELQRMEEGAPKGFHPLYQTAAQSVNWGKGALEALKFALPAAGTGALTALALGQLGPQAAFPEEIATVPGAAIAFGKVGAAAGAGHYAYQLERNLAFDQYLDLKDKAGNPLDPKKAANAAELVGVINGALETVGDVVLFKGVAQPIGKAGIAALSKVPGAAKVLGYIQKNPAIFAKMTMGQAVRQAVKSLMLTEVGEISTEYAQEVVTGAGQNLAISMSGQQISKTPTLDILSQASGVISPTAQAVLLPGLLGGSFNVYNAKKAIAVAEQNAQAFTAMTEATKNSATFKRLPEAYQELVNEATKDGPIDGVWIRPAVLEEHLAKQGVDPAQALAEIGIDNKLYQDAKDMGDLKIPMNQWTKIVQSEKFAGIANDIRLHQEDLSLNEAKELDSENKKREAEAEKGLQEMVSQTEAATAKDPQTKADWDKVYTQVKTELEAVGSDPEGADKDAKMWTAITINEAKARGITVDQLLAGRPGITGTAKATSQRLNQFAGANATTADHLGLSKAQELEKAGRTTQQIRSATGWFRGDDKLWRFEIDDSKATINERLIKEGKPKDWDPRQEAILLPNILQHDALFSAYPDLKNVKIITMSFDDGTKAATDGSSVYFDYEWVRGATGEQIKQTLLHEIQHIIQARENFSNGGSPDVMTAKASDMVEQEHNRLMDEVEKFRKDNPDFNTNATKRKQLDELWDRAVAMSGGVAIRKKKIELYRNLAGEIEARDTADRANFTEEQRKQNPPDVGRPEAIVVFGGKKFAYVPSGEQYSQAAARAITDSPEFKAWFGDSKVVDEKGQPLVVYHGTDAKFSIFSDTARGGSLATIYKAFYFTDNENMARKFGKNIMPVFLKSENPVVIDYSNSPLTWADIQTELAQIDAGMSPSEDLQNSIVSGGFENYDSVVIKNADYEGREPFTEYIIKTPEQIKSVNNRGTFDPNNPNILFQSPAESFGEIEGDYLYHNSSARNLESIRAEGLKTEYANEYPHGLPDIPDSKKRLYFAEDPNRSTEFGGRSTSGELAPLLLRVKKSALGKDVYKSNLSGGETWFFGDRIPPENIEVKTSYGWEPLIGKDTYFQSAGRELAPTFYSKLQRTLEAKMPEKASPAQIQGIIKDLKPEELKWSGINEFLAGKDKISKQELIDFLRGNQLEIKEVTKGETVRTLSYGSEVHGDEALAFISRGQDVFEKSDTNFSNPLSAEEIDPDTDYVLGEKQKEGSSPTKFSTYQLPGGENYREILFTLPKREPPQVQVDISGLRVETTRSNEYTGQRDITIRSATGEWLGSRSGFRGTDEEALRDYANEQQEHDTKTEASALNYASPHWDERNVLAHTRVNDRVDADGKKVLFIEEIQSDWHQTGREKGYKENIKPIPLTADEKAELEILLKDSRSTYGFYNTPEGQRAEYLLGRQNPGSVNPKVPDAPFCNTIGKGLSGWAGFVLKRMIRYAAENGYDRIAWTTGEQQAERYDLSKQVDKIYWERQPDGSYKMDAWRKDTGGYLFQDKELSASELSNWVGEELAKQISESKETHAVIRNADLKFGGEWAKSFYDQMIPQVLNKFGKKFGAKVENGLVSTNNTGDGKYFADTEAHIFDITPALKEAALYDGFSLFQSAWHGSPYDFDEFSLHKIGSGEGAQAYGWGLYFAGNKAIAESYRKKLSESRDSANVHWTINGEKIDTNGKFWRENFEIIQHIASDGYEATLLKSEMILAERKAKLPEGHTLIRTAEKQVEDVRALSGKEIKQVVSSTKWGDGKLYEVEIPEADKLLDWDKPLSRQSEYVKEKLKVAGFEPKKIEYKQEANRYKAIGIGIDGEIAVGYEWETHPYTAYVNGTTTKFKTLDGAKEFIAAQQDLGSGIYGDLIYKHGQSSEAASKYLNSIGIQGIKYLDSNSRADGEGSYNYVIFDDKAVEIINKYYQKKNKAPRGYYDPSTNIIGLLKNKDRSTFMHESAHYWLQSIYYFVQSGQADEAYLKRWEPMKTFLGIKDEQTTLTRDQQEKFARHMEAYLMEGKSPSIELREAFASFRQWLLDIYKTIKGLGRQAGFPIEMTPEARDYFDHLFASEQEIQAAQAETGADISSLPADEQIDALRNQANAEAMDTLTKAVMKELRADYLKEKRDYKTKFTKEEEQRLRENPTYSAMETLRKSKAFSGKEPKEISDLYLNGGLTDEGRAQFDSIAVALGHEDGYPLARMISQAAPFGDVLADHVELEMASKYASLEDTPDFREQAIAAIHNDRQLELMALEREVLRGLTSKQPNKAVRKPLTEVTRRAANVEAKVIKRKASDILSSKPYREASQFRIFITAEKNAAIALGRALAKKDNAAAVTAKQHQMFNHALAMEALRIKEQGENVFEFLSKAGDKTEKLPSSGKLPIVATANIQVNRLLSRFGFADLLSVPEGTPTLAQYVEDLKAHADDAVVADWLLTEGAPVTGWKDLSIEQLLDLKDAVISIKHAGKRENVLSTGESIDDVANIFTAAISANLKAKPNSYDPAARNTIMDTAAKFVNSHRSLSYIFRALDGFKVGEISQFVMGRLRKARHNESVMGTEAVGKLEALWDKHYPAEGNTPFLRWKNRTDMATAREFFEDPAINAIFPKGVTKENLIMMALNQGTELNKQRLLESYAMKSVDEEGNPTWQYRLTQDNVDKMLSRLGENDWKFIQDVLDLVNSYWPKIAELERNRTGLEPRKREAVTINTPYGNFSGGYFHIEYDPRASEPAQRQSIEDSMKGAIEGSHIVPSTRRGHTKETVTHVYNRPLLLQFSVIDRHLQSVIHDLAFIETIRDLDRVLTNDRVTAAITGTIGEGAYRQIRPALSYIGFENRPQSSPVDAMLSGIRSRASAFYLMFRVTSILSQIAGAGVAMGSVGAHKYVANLVTMTPTKARMILDKSRIMRERLGNRDRDVRDAMRSFMEKGKLNNITKYGFFLQGYMDIAVALPQWMAAYEDELQRQVQAGEQASEDKAVTAADETVQSTQGSGDPIDLSAMQRGSEFMKLLTMFYTPFAPLANKQIELWERLQENGVKDIPAVMSFLTFWIVLPGVMAATLSGDLPDGDDDDQSWFTWLIRNSLSQFFGGWVGARDMASYVTNKTVGRDMGYRLSPVETTIEKLLKPMADVGKTMKGDDVELSTIVKDTAESAMLLFKLPGRQISITTGYIIDLMTGEAEFEPQRLIYPEKKK